MSSTSAPSVRIEPSAVRSGSDQPVDRYDAVVIGSGIGGLTSAAVMARAGMRVLVVEQAPAPGGCTRALRAGGYVADPAVHVTGQGAPGEIFDDVTRYLGVADQLELVPIGHYYAVVTPDGTLRLPSGFDAFVRAHEERFPAEAERIRRFFDLCAQVHREAHELPPNVALKDLDEVVARYPVLFAHTRSTLAEVLEEHLTDPSARAVCAASWPYIGIPPSRVSFLTFTQMLFSQMEGTYYSLGSFQRLVDALVSALRAHGGELRCGVEVASVEVDGRRVRGVRLGDGRRVAAPVVVSAGDATRLFESLLDADALPPRAVGRVRRMRPSWSAFVVVAATSVDLADQGLAHETFCYRHRDHADTDADITTGRPGGMWLNVPTLVDPSVAPPGEHLMIMTSLARHDVPGGWEEAAPRYTAELLAEIERVCPGVRGRLRVIEAVTPVGLERSTGNRGGAIYGWDYVPNQSGGKRLPHRTDVEGLFLAGHWTQPGAATLRVLVSGIHTAQLALRAVGRPDAADVGFRDLPPV